MLKTRSKGITKRMEGNKTMIDLIEHEAIEIYYALEDKIDVLERSNDAEIGGSKEDWIDVLEAIIEDIGLEGFNLGRIRKLVQSFGGLLKHKL
jgi:hypothetical protein